MVPINPQIAHAIANQRIQENLDEVRAHRLASKGRRRRLGVRLPVRVGKRRATPVPLWARIAGRAY
jgi:hypothetical protein